MSANLPFFGMRRPMQSIGILLAIWILSPVLASFAFGATYYVSARSGDDSRSLRTARHPFKPWKTIQHAVDQVVAGDNVVVLPGIYEEHVRIQARGTSRRPITIESLQYGAAKIVGSIGGIGVAHIKLRSFDVSNSRVDDLDPVAIYDPKGIYFYTCHDIEIAQNQVHDCRGGGIAVNNSDEVEICENVVFGNAAGFDGGHSGISIFQPLSLVGSRSGTFGTRIVRNICFGNSNSVYLDENGQPKPILDGHGIIIDDSRRMLIDAFNSLREYYKEVVPDLDSLPLDPAAPYSRSILIEGNLCHSNGGCGVLAYQSSGVVIRNNTAVHNQNNIYTFAEVFVFDSSDTDVLNNLMISPLQMLDENPDDMRVAGKFYDSTLGTLTSPSVTWTYNAIYDSPTLQANIPGETYDQETTVALQDPENIITDAATGAFTCLLGGQTFNRGKRIRDCDEFDLRYGFRVQGRRIDIGAIEGVASPLPKHFDWFSWYYWLCRNPFVFWRAWQIPEIVFN